MKKMIKKVLLPAFYDEVWQCPRCIQDYCGDCVNKFKVNFEVKDKKDCAWEVMIVQWKGLLVCPWCYNQLAKIHNNRKEDKISEE